MSDPQTFRASWTSCLVLGGVFGGIFAFSLYAMLFTHPSFWKAAVTFGVAFLLVVLWLAAFQIRITAGELTFRSLFGGTRQILRRDIHDIRLRAAVRPTGSPLRLDVRSVNTADPVMTINAKVFTREAIRQVLGLARPIDPEGQKSWIVNQAIDKRWRDTQSE